MRRPARSSSGCMSSPRRPWAPRRSRPACCGPRCVVNTQLSVPSLSPPVSACLMHTNSKWERAALSSHLHSLRPLPASRERWLARTSASTRAWVYVGFAERHRAPDLLQGRVSGWRACICPHAQSGSPAHPVAPPQPAATARHSSTEYVSYKRAQEPRPHHLAPIGEPTITTTAPGKIFLDKSPNKLAAKRKPVNPLPARTPTHPASPLTPIRGGVNQGGGHGAGAGPGSPLRGKPDDGSFGTDPREQVRVCVIRRTAFISV
jgi:hypothetical protein